MERRSDNVQDAAGRLQELITRPSLVKKRWSRFHNDRVEEFERRQAAWYRTVLWELVHQIQAILDVVKNERVRKEYAIKVRMQVTFI